MTCGKYWEGRVEAGLARPPPGRGHRADEDTPVIPGIGRGPAAVDPVFDHDLTGNDPYVQAHEGPAPDRDRLIVAGLRGAARRHARWGHQGESETAEANSWARVNRAVILHNSRVGRHAVVENAILDKNVIVAEGATVGVDKEHDQARGFVVSHGGITVVGKGQVVAP